MRTALASLALVLLLVAPPALAQRRGTGSGRAPGTAPPTKSAGPPEEAAHRPSPDPVLLPPHGMMGAPGAALDSLGPSRLGPHGETSVAPSYGEAAQRGSGGGESYQAWKSGDRVRSTSSADVRSARQQQAPDLEWASANGPAAPQLEPQTPYGEKVQQPRQRKK